MAASTSLPEPALNGQDTTVFVHRPPLEGRNQAARRKQEGGSRFMSRRRPTCLSISCFEWLYPGPSHSDERRSQTCYFRVLPEFLCDIM